MGGLSAAGLLLPVSPALGAEPDIQADLDFLAGNSLVDTASGQADVSLPDLDNVCAPANDGYYLVEESASDTVSHAGTVDQPLAVPSSADWRKYALAALGLVVAVAGGRRMAASSHEGLCRGLLQDIAATPFDANVSSDPQLGAKLAALQERRTLLEADVLGSQVAGPDFVYYKYDHNQHRAAWENLKLEYTELLREVSWLKTRLSDAIRGVESLITRNETLLDIAREPDLLPDFPIVSSGYMDSRLARARAIANNPDAPVGEVSSSLAEVLDLFRTLDKMCLCHWERVEKHGKFVYGYSARDLDEELREDYDYLREIVSEPAPAPGALGKLIDYLQRAHSRHLDAIKNPWLDPYTRLFPVRDGDRHFDVTIPSAYPDPEIVRQNIKYGGPSLDVFGRYFGDRLPVARIAKVTAHPEHPDWIRLWHEDIRPMRRGDGILTGFYDTWIPVDPETFVGFLGHILPEDPDW